MGDISPNGSKNIDESFKTFFFVSDKLFTVLIISVKQNIDS